MLVSWKVGEIYREGRSSTWSFGAEPALRKDVDSLRGLLIDTPYGGSRRLGDVADMNVVPTPNEISARTPLGGSTYGNVKGRDLGSVAQEVEQAGVVTFRLGYHPSFWANTPRVRPLSAICSWPRLLAVPGSS